jgi:HEAT repeat protein
LVALLKREDLSDYVRTDVARALGRIAMDNEEVIETLSIMSDNYKYGYLYENIIKTLGKAKIRKKDAAAKILAVLEGENPNLDLCFSVRYALENISGNEEWIIDRLIELVSGKESETHFYKALETLGSIAVGNQNAINYLIGVLVDKNNITYTFLINYTVLDALEKIAIGSKPAITCLLELLKSKELSGKPYHRIAEALGIIAAKEQWVVAEIAKLIESKNFGNTED